MLKNTQIDIRDKISKIRTILKEKKLNGFLLPRSDSFLGEYIHESAARLEWLTGFSGSTGELLILDNKAILFVDNRYIIQAKNETKNTGIKVILTSDISLLKWLKKNVKYYRVIGYDPWLYSVKKISSIKNCSKNSKFQIKPINKNPVDILWIKNRPSKPTSLIIPHPLKYSGKRSKEKIQNLLYKIKHNKADAFLVCKSESLAWLLNIRGNDLKHTPVILFRSIIHSNGNIDIYINKNKLDKKALSHIKKCTKSLKIFDEHSIFDSILNLFKKNKKILIDPNFTPQAFICRKSFKLSSFILKPCPIEINKAIKNKKEISGSIQAHIKDGVSLCNFLYWLSNTKKSITELSAAKKIDSLRSKQKNFICTSFETISGFSRNGAIIHYKANEKSNLKFKRNQLYLVDSGGQYLEGTTDVTRTIAIGKPTNEMIKFFTIVLKANIALAKIVFPYGTSGHDLDIVAREKLWEEGLDYGHGTGHGVGSCLSVHEGPQRISLGSTEVLEPGMILSNEPGFYLEDRFGIRIENLMLVEKNKENKFNKKLMLSFRTLTLAPIDKKLISYKLLSKNEVNWLNKYHKHIYSTISISLPKTKRIWLKNCCKPIN